MPRPQLRRSDAARQVCHEAGVAAFPHGPRCLMDLPGRRFLCAGCRTAVLICSHCDRGQRYCTRGCAGEARRRSVRAAGCRYQASRPGRHAHAERQRRYRARTALHALHSQNVTHQGSPPPACADLLASEPSVPVQPVPWHCVCCQRPLPDWVRQGFLRRRIRRRPPDRRTYAYSPRN